ncbi:hypothetical protein M426DRAFT_128716 [Hypoxylon sp. CI-4A]|nr:hypothetical protein M426DRAFT_128716 [Hypoxylon sp. CI-4A]
MHRPKPLLFMALSQIHRRINVNVPTYAGRKPRATVKISTVRCVLLLARLCRFPLCRSGDVASQISPIIKSLHLISVCAYLHTYLMLVSLSLSYIDWKYCKSVGSFVCVNQGQLHEKKEGKYS